jgi:hypothetical protein
VRSPPEPIEHEKTLTLRGALPLIVGLGLLITLLLTWQLRIIADGPGETLHGARPADSYGFDLETCLIPRDELVGTVARKGDIPSMDTPVTMEASRTDPPEGLLGRIRPVKDLIVKGGDRVVGMIIDGTARAYPLWILAAHEVCNDELGGTPIAVTYSPLCDSAVVFDRRVGDETLLLAASGMVYNSNTLLYDRRAGGGGEDSLWCQLQARAVAGPAAKLGKELKVLPSYVVTWSAWRAAYPESTVIAIEPTRTKVYRPNAYFVYFNDPKLRYPVNPRPSQEHPLKTPMVAVREGAEWRVSPAATFDPLRDVQGRPTMYAFWFAWDSIHR